MEIHGSKYDYSEVKYEHSGTKVTIICKTHGIFLQKPSSHIFQKSGCPKCSAMYSPTTEEWIKKAIEIHGVVYDYSAVKYKNTNKKITIICKTHGEFQQKPNSHVSDKSGCSKCVNCYIPTTKEWIEKAIEVHGDTYDYSATEYKNLV